MNDLHNAYATLGVPVGSSMEAITRRYKRLIMVWHPDRAHTPEQKEFAEEELKKINNAKDLLTKHFGSTGDHKASGCRCQSGPADAGASRGSSSSSGPSPGPGPNYHRSKSAQEKQQEEEAARKRDADRKRREQEEANAKAAEEAQRRASAAAGQTMDTAMQQQNALQDEKLRWKISIGLIIAFIALELFGAMAIGAKSWWHDVTWKWQSEWNAHNQPEKKEDPPITSTDTSTGTDTSTTTIDTTPIVTKPDPCAGTYPSATPPEFILPNTHNWVRQAVTAWTVKCNGSNQGGTVTGRDEKGRLLDMQEYGTDWAIVQQWTFKYGWAGSGEEVTVDLYKPAFDFMGRSIYAYDSEHNLIEVRQLDGHQRAIVTAKIERRPGGGFYQTVLQSFDIETGAPTTSRTLYDPDDLYMSSTFYQYGMFGSIPKTIASPSDSLFPYGTLPEDPTKIKPILGDDILKKYGLDKLPSTDHKSFFDNNKKPYSSPFSQPIDSGTLIPPSSSTPKLSDLLKKSPLDSGSSTTKPSSNLIDSDFLKKYCLNSGSLETSTPSSSKVDELIRKFELEHPGSTSVKKN